MESKSTGIKIRYSNAETLKNWLLAHKVINPRVSFLREENHLVIPVDLTIDEAGVLVSSLEEIEKYEVGEFYFPEKDLKPKNLYDAIIHHIPQEIHEYIPKSFETIGDICIIEIPDEIMEYKKLIGISLHSIFPSIKTVYRKASAVTGELRIRELELIAGKEKCSTTHLEYGVRICVDVCKTYFSPRLGFEHHRVASNIKENEIIVDFFTGVGSFPLHIAKTSNSIIYAIDINETAIECLRNSIMINKLKGSITPILGDCRKVIDSLPKADRIIMNLPGKAHEFIDLACKVIKPEGLVYFYQFVQEEDGKEIMLKNLEKKLKKHRWVIKEIVGFHKIRESAPREIQACLELILVPS